MAQWFLYKTAISVIAANALIGAGISDKVALIAELANENSLMMRGISSNVGFLQLGSKYRFERLSIVSFIAFKINSPSRSEIDLDDFAS